MTAFRSECLDIMTDVESVGLHRGDGIWQIGAVVLGTDEKFIHTINPEVFDTQPHRLDLNTISWQGINNFENWEAARTIPNTVAAAEALMIQAFYTWVDALISAEPHKQLRMWCKGLDFDYPMIEAAGQLSGLHPPWKYYQRYDARTLYSLFSLPKFSGGHDALADAIIQMEKLNLLLERIECI